MTVQTENVCDWMWRDWRVKCRRMLVVTSLLNRGLQIRAGSSLTGKMMEVSPPRLAQHDSGHHGRQSLLEMDEETLWMRCNRSTRPVNHIHVRPGRCQVVWARPRTGACRWKVICLRPDGSLQLPSVQQRFSIQPLLFCSGRMETNQICNTQGKHNTMQGGVEVTGAD